MAFWHALTVPANTLQSDPAKEFVLLVRGILSEIEIWFPPGCAGLVHCQVYDGPHQVFPREDGQSFVGDDWHILIKDALPIHGEPFGLTVLGWSPGASYDHTIYIHFELGAETVITVSERSVVAFPGSGERF